MRPTLYLRMLKENSPRAGEVLELLKMNEGNNSGRGIGCVSWDGRVHADQFWRNHTFGNVRERPFSEIWTDPQIELLARLKEKKKSCDRSLPDLSLAGCLRRELPGQGRGRHRRPLGTGSGLLSDRRRGCRPDKRW